MAIQPVHKIIYSLKLVDYLHVQADKPWYNYYLVKYWKMASFFFEKLILVCSFMVVRTDITMAGSCKKEFVVFPSTVLVVSPVPRLFERQQTMYEGEPCMFV